MRDFFNDHTSSLTQLANGQILSSVCEAMNLSLTWVAH